MNRHALDRFADRYRLGPEAIATALEFTGLKPSANDGLGFAAVLMRHAGLGAVGAGLLFFVAANWQELGLYGRFALLQVALLGAVVIALWRPPPALAGQGALLVATLATGGLLALFGQSYQTGADVHELFFTWAALSLPFVLAGLSGALWAVWWGVLNIALALLCGWTGLDHFVWSMAFGRGIERSTSLMLPCVIDLLAAGAFVALHRTRWATAAPAWLARSLAAAGMTYGTLAVIVVIVSANRVSDEFSTQGMVVVLLFAALSIGIGLATWRHRRDAFPMALLAASWIAICTAWLARAMRFDDVGSYFLIAVWLIAASTGSGVLLMRWVRAWQPAPVAIAGAAA